MSVDLLACTPDVAEQGQIGEEDVDRGARRACAGNSKLIKLELGCGRWRLGGEAETAGCAASRSTSGPARALEVLGTYARSVEGAPAATAVQVLIDTHMRLLVYNTAGHPPPVLLHADGTCELLDQATDPPLGVWAENVPRSQVALTYKRGDAPVMYTDGLIERRREDIDVGLARSTAALDTCAGLNAEHLADAVLGRLGVSRASRDDITLVVASL